MIKTLFHYCSLRTFCSIVSNKSIWLTALRDSNDHFEGRWLRDRFSKLDQGPDKEYARKASLVLDSAAEGCSKILGICLSAERDLLSQWRGYADDGFGISIGFSVAAIKSIISRVKDHPRIELELEAIEYRQTLDAADLKDLKAYVDRQQYSLGGGYEQYTIDNAGLQLWVRRSALMKNPAFSEEREYRLFTLFADPNATMYMFRVAGSKLSPYLELRFEDAVDSIIDSVTIGPKNTSSTEEIRLYMKKCGYNGRFGVHKSGATYR